MVVCYIVRSIPVPSFVDGYSLSVCFCKIEASTQMGGSEREKEPQRTICRLRTKVNLIIRGSRS
jgi:hypothetical protein